MERFVPMEKLLREAFSFKKYKALPLAVAIVIGVLLFPLWLLSAVAVALYALCEVVVSLFDYPVETLHDIITKEGKEVKAAAQAFIYIFAWPLYIYFKFCILLLSSLNYVFFFFANVFLYVATLCGVKFDIKMNGEVERDLTPEEKTYSSKKKGIILLIVLAICLFPVLPFVAVFFVVTLPLDIFVLIFLFFGTKLFDNAFKEKPAKEKKAKKEKHKKEEKVEEEPVIEEDLEEKIDEVIEEEKHEEPLPAEEPVGEQVEEEHHEEHHEEHFDFSTLDEYNKNRHPADDYQAERLDDLEDDYDRR